MSASAATAILLLAICLPGDPDPMGLDDARHLLGRAGFAPTPAELQVFASLPREEGVRRLLDGTRVTPVTPMPEWVHTAPGDLLPPKGATRKERMELRRRGRQMGEELKAWWAGEMVATDSPFTEQMVLFWHNHFTSGLRKVRSPIFMARQNALFRRHASGSLRVLLHEIARDPAMLLYLDTQRNNKARPNENFARELLELFTLGEGHYGEADVKEAARAFTGWKVDARRGAFRKVRRQHDGGAKTFLGQRGDLDGEEILDILLEHPRLALTITEKLWREFISDAPVEEEVERLAVIFRASDLQMEPLLEALFSSPFFWEAAGRGSLIRSPVELVVGTARTFGAEPERPALLARAIRSMGQDLLDPPNVKGWPGGERWITATTLLARRGFLAAALRGQGMGGKGAGGKGKGARALTSWWRSLGESRSERLERARRVLLPTSPVHSLPPGNGPQAALRHLLLDPAYQLK
ncbi:MAG: DUF1800 family protein [Planctomycetota bacterium]